MSHDAPRSFSRRRFARGVAWTLPTTVLATTAPAIAASACPSKSVQLIDDAFQQAEEQLQCNGRPITLEINFYQPLAANDSSATDAYVNIKNLSSCTMTFSKDFPLEIDIAVRAAETRTVTNRRSLTGVRTSWGTRTRDDSMPVTGAEGGVHHKIRWEFSGSDPLPGKGLGDNEADLAIGFGGGGTGVIGQRLTSYLEVTPLAQSGAPSWSYLQSLGVGLECYDLYVERLSAWVSPVQWVYSGPRSSGPLPTGTTLDSRNSGNYSSATGAASTNGIW